ncbi:glycerol-3-phosphate dehydrogenase C-terminal domain-containing protein, partial [Vibrio astriarenae]
REQLVQDIHAKHAWLPIELLLRYVTQFGTHTWDLLEGTSNEAELGRVFSTQAGGVYQREIDYLIGVEMAITEEDILWRRTKLGLYLN